MTTPLLHLRTLFTLDEAGRITATREPGSSRPATFSLIRGAASCAWAIHADVPQHIADELDSFARREPPAANLRDAPVYAHHYASLIGGEQSAGPAFHFPEALSSPSDVVAIHDEREPDHHFKGWVPGEIAAGRAPVLAIVEDGHPVSICFCSRLSDEAAEAGLDTAPGYRGRGFGPRVTAAWALAIRASGRIPLYSTTWSNDASLTVARKVGLIPYASHWRLSELQ